MKQPDLAEIHALPGAERTPTLVIDSLRREADKIARITCIVEYEDRGVEIRISDMSFDQLSTQSHFLEWALMQGFTVSLGGGDED